MLPDTFVDCAAMQANSSLYSRKLLALLFTGLRLLSSVHMCQTARHTDCSLDSCGGQRVTHNTAVYAAVCVPIQCYAADTQVIQPNDAAGHGKHGVESLKKQRHTLLTAAAGTHRCALDTCTYSLLLTRAHA
jgi:hypothetical protein